jgi:hypothetical protein
MDTQHTQDEAQSSASAPGPRDSAYWAQPVDHLRIATLAGVSGLNVEGRHVIGPLQGFGQMWQKTYRVLLNGTTQTPAEVISIWKANFASFWPRGNQFYGPLTGIAPGEIGIIHISVGGPVKLSTGVMVIYADEESFTFMTPEGHMFAAWITFSAYDENSVPVAQVLALLRADDPLYELGLRLGFIHKAEDRFWTHTLMALANYCGANGQVQQQTSCIDPKMQWSRAKNIWYNAAIRTTLYRLTWPMRQIGDVFVRRR